MTQAQPMVFLVDVDNTLLAAHSMRAVPGLTLFRSADANEVVGAYRCIMQLRHRPAAITLSRQPLPTFDRNRYASAEGVAGGAYVMADPPKGSPEIILIATGGEVAIAIGAYETLTAEGLRDAWCQCRRGMSSRRSRNLIATARCRRRSPCASPLSRAR